jgi:hypothetical protein
MKNILIVWFAAAVSIATFACGGPTREAQIALTTSASALRIVDREVAERYSAAAHEARTEAATLEAYETRMHDWNDAESALRVAHSTFLLAQDGLDAWRAGDQSRWLEMVPCLVSGIDRLRIALSVLGVEIPELTSAVSLVAGFAGPCRIEQ